MSRTTTTPEHATAEAELPGIGRIAIIASARGLVSVDFLSTSRPRIASTGNATAARVRDRALRELARYPAGGALTCPVDLRGQPPFAGRVLELLRQVPRGRTVSYGELAALAGCPGGARAVGNACARNPVPLWVPCHRVLAGGGRLGGFSGGLDVKRALLALEGAQPR
jgi:methylated-DNA-[protein]-cysteine S-methyltransferase